MFCEFDPGCALYFCMLQFRHYLKPEVKGVRNFMLNPASSLRISMNIKGQGGQSCVSLLTLLSTDEAPLLVHFRSP